MELTRNPILSLAAQIVSAHVGNNATSTDTLPALIRDVYRTLAQVGHETGASAAGALAPARAPARAVPMEEAEDFDEPEEHDQHNGHNGHAHPPVPDGGRTVFSDHLVCMDCGLSMKMLKRHLITVHAVTPEEYREKWSLPPDYPMVASEYAALRSSLAKQSGLGKRPEVKSKVPHHRVVAARARR
jgi:predicted transcriptional regulator